MLELFEDICEIVLNADRQSALLEAICEFMSADAGNLWTNYQTGVSKNKFVLKAVYNRPEFEDDIDGLYFVLGDKNNVSMKAVESQKPIHGIIDLPPFDENWTEKNTTKNLASKGIKEVAIVPVFDESDNPIYILTLFFKKFDPNFKDYLEGLGSLIGATHEAITVRLTALRLERRKDRHEIISHARLINEKIDKIKASLPLKGGEFSTSRKRFADIERSLVVLRHSYESSSFKERVSDRHSSTEFHNLLDFLKDSQSAIAGNIRNINEVMPGSVTGNKSLELLFNTGDLVMLFSNLYENANKYSIAGSVVRTNVKKHEKVVEISIRNDIKVSSDDDLEKIWAYEYRGESAINGEFEGKGIGLGLVADICDVYDIEFSAHYEKSETKKLTKVFHMKLLVPMNLIRQGN